MPEIARDAVEMCCTICMMITCNTRAYKSHNLLRRLTCVTAEPPQSEELPLAQHSSRLKQGLEQPPDQILGRIGFLIYWAKIQSLKHAMSNLLSSSAALLGTPEGTRDANSKCWFSQGNERHRG